MAATTSELHESAWRDINPDDRANEQRIQAYRQHWLDGPQFRVHCQECDVPTDVPATASAAERRNAATGIGGLQPGCWRPSCATCGSEHILLHGEAPTDAADRAAGTTRTCECMSCGEWSWRRYFGWGCARTVQCVMVCNGTRADGTRCRSKNTEGHIVLLKSVRTPSVDDEGSCLMCLDSAADIRARVDHLLSPNVVSYPCGCFYCLECFPQAVDFALLNDASELVRLDEATGFYSPPCRVHPTAFLPEPQVFKLAGRRRYERMRDWATRVAVKAAGGVECPLAGCRSPPVFFPPDDGEGVLCPACSRRFCRLCNQPWDRHAESCELYEGNADADFPAEDDPIERSRLIIERALTKGLHVRCPGRCRRAIEKGPACIHIRSCGSPDCNTEFCYGCGLHVADCRAGREAGTLSCPGRSTFLDSAYFLARYPAWHSAVNQISRRCRIPAWAAANSYFLMTKAKVELVQAKRRIGAELWEAVRQVHPQLLQDVITEGGGRPRSIPWESIGDTEPAWPPFEMGVEHNAAGDHAGGAGEWVDAGDAGEDEGDGDGPCLVQ